MKGGVHKLNALKIRHCISFPSNKYTSSSSFAPPLSQKTGAVEVTRFIYIYCSKKEREKTRALNVHSKMDELVFLFKEQQEVYIYVSVTLNLFRQNCPYRRPLPVSKMCRPYSFILGLFSDGLVTIDYAVLNGHLIPK